MLDKMSTWKTAFPARAGMNRLRSRLAFPLQRVPRPRGDEPDLIMMPARVALRSPPARG